jgi:hypothetical protein
MNDWTALGTFNADLDAHIVETDSTGLTSIGGGVFGATAATFAPLTVNSNSNGIVMLVASDSASYTALYQNSAAGVALQGDCSATGTIAILGDGNTVGVGVEGRGGSTSGAGINGIALGATAPGVQGTGSAAAGSSGVQGTSAHVDASGVNGTTIAGASVSGKAVRGAAQGNGTGVHGQAVDGYGVVAVSDTTSPTRAALRIAPQDADPTTNAAGDISVLDEGGSQVWLKMSKGGAPRYMRDGIYPRGEDGWDREGSIQTWSGASTETPVTAQFQAYQGGDVMITCRFGLSATTNDSIDYEIDSEDSGGGSIASHETGTVYIDDTTNNTTSANKYITVQLKVTPPTANNRDYRLKLTRNSGTPTMRRHYCSIRVEGELN